MLAKLVRKALYLQPEGISDEELKKDWYKEYVENEAPANLPKTQQAVCKLEDNGDKIVMSWDIVPAEPDPTDALAEVQKQIMLSILSDRDDKTIGVKCMSLFPVYTQDKQHNTGDVARHPDTGYPYECMTSYNGTVQQDWTIDNRTLWKPWHSRDQEYALPWVAPTGAHDMYKAGEYMIWTDEKVYECKQDTNFSPTEYAQAWSGR